MTYSIRAYEEEFFFDTDYHVRVKSDSGLNNRSINTIMIYSVEKVDGDYDVIEHFKMNFEFGIYVDVSKNSTGIRVWNDSMVLDIKREMINAGIEVRDEI